MYPEEIVKPMRQELVNAGFKELHSADEVDNILQENGTTLIVVNSVCGCAAGTARPGTILSLQGDKKPMNITTVFAGVDAEAVAKAREHMIPFPPSSPA
ncbi:MAG: BrxA/BrxB family bacilliredoxin, partial [Aureibaculum sp.]|nr:BrxA/BrxB family bacilliredoxin [Aureibaculum sp.]